MSNKDYIKWIRSKVGREMVCDNQETMELKYFPLDNLPELFCKQHEDMLEDVREGR